MLQDKCSQPITVSSLFPCSTYVCIGDKYIKRVYTCYTIKAIYFYASNGSHISIIIYTLQQGSHSQFAATLLPAYLYGKPEWTTQLLEGVFSISLAPSSEPSQKKTDEESSLVCAELQL